jgi:uncharacterized protein YidB (DUF937 family)
MNMGLLDQITGALGGQGSGAGGSLQSILELINNPQIGGLQGLIQKFHDGGAGEVVKSWVSTGQNLPISADQINSVLGNDAVKDIAAKLGIDPAAASGHLAEMLPQIVDKLTPGGAVPTGGNLLEEGLSLLKGKLFS